MAKQVEWWGIWCKDESRPRLPNEIGGYWLRRLVNGHEAIQVFTSKAIACSCAAEEFGFWTYTEAKRKGWCEVRRLSDVEPGKKRKART